jgi:hypothetical protein
MEYRESIARQVEQLNNRLTEYKAMTPGTNLGLIAQGIAKYMKRATQTRVEPPTRLTDTLMDVVGEIIHGTMEDAMRPLNAQMELSTLRTLHVEATKKEHQLAELLRPAAAALVERQLRTNEAELRQLESGLLPEEVLVADDMTLAF